MIMKSVIIPDKLNKGDEIRVIAPSQSMCLLSEETIAIAKQRLEALGFRVTFGKHVFQQIDENYACASIAERVADLHDAFADPNVKGILTAIGGFNINQLLNDIDFGNGFCCCVLLSCLYRDFFLVVNARFSLLFH